ncbi:MAG: hypothetical protein P8125_12590 [Gemmatimonadota bacterium]
MSEFMGLVIGLGTLVFYGLLFWLFWTMVDTLKGIHQELHQIRAQGSFSAPGRRAEDVPVRGT